MQHLDDVRFMCGSPPPPCHLGTKTSLLVSMWSHEYWEPVRTKCQTVVMAGTPPDASQVPVQAVMLP